MPCLQLQIPCSDKNRGCPFQPPLAIAYGPENRITCPPKPAAPRQPGSMRLRAKSNAIPGMDLGGMQQMDDGHEGQPQQSREKPSLKELLTGIPGGRGRAMTRRPLPLLLAGVLAGKTIVPGVGSHAAVFRICSLTAIE